MAKRHHSTASTSDRWIRTFKNLIAVAIMLVGLCHLAITGDTNHVATIGLGYVMLATDPNDLRNNAAFDLIRALTRWLVQHTRP